MTKILSSYIVDTIVRPVSTGDAASKEYFSLIEEFGEYIQSKKGKSGTVELVEQCVSAGGNAPNFTEGVSHLGFAIRCIGTLGYPEIDTHFKKLEEGAGLISIGAPGTCTALEFKDGKIMLSYPEPLNRINWAAIRGRLQEELISMFSEADSYAFLNWSELPQCNDIWRGILKDVCRTEAFVPGKPLLVDLCDFSGRAGEELGEALDILRQMNRYFEVTVSMNENEASGMSGFLQCDESGSIREKGKLMYERLGVKKLVIHTIEAGYGWDACGGYEVRGKVVEHPVISTGAGDRYNAGLCMGLLCRLSVEEGLALAGGVSSYFLETGKNGTWQDVKAYLTKEKVKAETRYGDGKLH